MVSQREHLSRSCRRTCSTARIPCAPACRTSTAIPAIAADLFEETLDEFLLCDDLGINVVAIEHHAGINSLFGANPLILGILARQTRKVRILSLGTLISLRPDPVRIAEEYATADVIPVGGSRSASSSRAAARWRPTTPTP